MGLSQLGTTKFCHDQPIHHRELFILEVETLKDFDKIVMANYWVANLCVGKITINIYTY